MTPNMPSGWSVVGKLDDSLCEDMLEATFGNIEIYAGWLPEEDPSGGYVVYVMRGCHFLSGPHRTRDVREAAALVEEMARMWERHSTARVDSPEPVRQDRVTRDPLPFNLDW